MKIKLTHGIIIRAAQEFEHIQDVTSAQSLGRTSSRWAIGINHLPLSHPLCLCRIYLSCQKWHQS